MNPTAFLLSLGVAIAAPLIVLHYLVPALRRASATADACEAGSSLDFWLAALRWLAILGTVMLVLSFGEFREGADLLTLRRTLWLVAAGLFVSVAVMARTVWHTLDMRERQRQQERLLRASLPATTMRPSSPSHTQRTQEV